MNKVNELLLCRENYESQEEFEDEIKKAVMLLLNANYIITVRYDEKGFGIIAIEYESANQASGGYYPYWLMPNEIEKILYDQEE